MNQMDKSSYYRNFVFGVEDSLVSTVGLLSGISIAGASASTIFSTGVILIFVEAISMGAGSFLSESSAEIYENHNDSPTNRSYKDAFIMFVSYLLSGFIPLLPYVLISDEQTAFWTSITLSLFVLMLLGVMGAKISNTRILKNVLRMVLVGGGAILVGSLVGQLLG